MISKAAIYWPGTAFTPSYITDFAPDMCLILFSWQQEPDWPLIMAANRDEFHARPTASLDWWDSHPEILAGRDLEQGGSWCGVNRRGMFAAITNYRDPDWHAPNRISRGDIVKRYLDGQQNPEEFLRDLDDQSEAYNGFNLLVGNMKTLCYYSNTSRQIQVLKPGLYGLSNGLLDTPWPKVSAGKHALEQAIAAGIESEHLFAVLADQHRPDDDCLPLTGVSLEWERLLAARFILSPDYGTRCSSLLQLGRNGEVVMCERSFNPEGEIQGNKAFRFGIHQ